MPYEVGRLQININKSEIGSKSIGQFSSAKTTKSKSNPTNL